MNKRSICTVAVALALGLSSAVRPGADASADELAGLAEIAARVSPGEWFEIPDTQMRQVLVKPDAVPEGAHGTRGPAAVLDDSGAAFDDRRLYVHGGGTKIYGGNEVYAFDLASLTWERLTEPTALRDPAAGKSCAGLVDEDRPPASATNDGVVWSRLTQSLFVWHSPVYCHDGWGGGRAGVWEFEPQERTWTYAAPHPGRWGAVTSVDPATGAVIVATKNHAWEFDVTAKQYTRRSPRTRLVTNGVAAIDAGRRLLVAIDDASGVRTVKLDGENLGSFESVLDELPHEDMYRWALVYHGGRKQFVLWTGSPEVYTLDPETWELALFDRAASGPKPPRRDAAVYSKWVYLVAHDVFVGVNSVDSGVWVYRMPDEPLAAGSNRVATAPPSVGAIKGKSGEGAVLRVCPPDEPGAGCGYTSLQRAVDDAEPGSVIVLAPGVYRQAAVVRRDRLTIRGEAGAHLMGTAAQGKGALVLKGNDTVVEGIECSGIAVKDRNGSCIKLEAEGLVVRNVYFHDSEQGILGGFGGTVIVENSRFERNGKDGFAHGSIYAGSRLDTLIFRNNTVLRTKGEGHGIKSRARRTVIENNVIAGLGGRDSRAIDIPVGGEVLIRNNVLEKGPFSGNAGLIGLSMEREKGLHEINGAIVEGNTIIFDGPLDKTGQIFQEQALGTIVYRNNRIIGSPSVGGLVQASGNVAFRDREAAGLKPYPSLPEPGS